MIHLSQPRCPPSPGEPVTPLPPMYAPRSPPPLSRLPPPYHSPAVFLSEAMTGHGWFEWD